MYQLRTATQADYDFLYALHVVTMKPSIEATWGWDEHWQKAYFQKHFDPARRQIIQVNSQDVGVISVENRQGERYLALIELLPSFQSRGLGTRLIHDFIQTALDSGQAASLHVLKANDAARRLYERLGFVVRAEEDVKYKMIYDLQKPSFRSGETSSRQR